MNLGQNTPSADLSLIVMSALCFVVRCPHALWVVKNVFCGLRCILSALITIREPCAWVLAYGNARVIELHLSGVSVFQCSVLKKLSVCPYARDWAAGPDCVRCLLTRSIRSANSLSDSAAGLYANSLSWPWPYALTGNSTVLGLNKNVSETEGSSEEAGKRNEIKNEHIYCLECNLF